MRNSIKTALFVSAFSPALMSVGVAHIWAKQAADWAATYYLLVGLLGSLSAVYIISTLSWLGEAFPFSAKKIESNDALMLGVVASYFVPFLGKAADMRPLIVVIIMIVAAFILWFSSSILPSPTLRLLGYRFYKIEADNGVVFTLMSTRDILDPKQVKKVKKISNAMLLEAT